MNEKGRPQNMERFFSYMRQEKVKRGGKKKTENGLVLCDPEKGPEVNQYQELRKQ